MIRKTKILLFLKKLTFKNLQMKSVKFFLGLAFVSLMIVSCKNENKEPETKTVAVEETVSKNDINPNAKIAKAEFTIEGMTCAIGCAKTIEKKLSTMEGVKSAKVDFDKKLAMVEYDEATVNTNALEETVTKTGEQYKVSGMKTVESFTTNGAKKGCDKDCKKACCAGKDKKECKKGDKKECKMKMKKECKTGDKSQANAGNMKAGCSGKSKKDCKKKKECKKTSTEKAK